MRVLFIAYNVFLAEKYDDREERLWKCLEGQNRETEPEDPEITTLKKPSFSELL